MLRYIYVTPHAIMIKHRHVSVILTFWICPLVFSTWFGIHHFYSSSWSMVWLMNRLLPLDLLVHLYSQRVGLLWQDGAGGQFCNSMLDIIYGGYLEWQTLRSYACPQHSTSLPRQITHTVTSSNSAERYDVTSLSLASGLSGVASFTANQLYSR
jgi:hypothetical protein